MKKIAFYISLVLIAFCLQTELSAQRTMANSPKKLNTNTNKPSLKTSRTTNTKSLSSSPKAKGNTSNTSKTGSNGVTITKSKMYDYILSAGGNENALMPSAQINLYNDKGGKVAKLNFFKDMNMVKKMASDLVIEENKAKVYNLAYSFEMFDFFVSILENGKNLEVHYDSKKKTASVATSAKAGLRR